VRVRTRVRNVPAGAPMPSQIYLHPEISPRVAGIRWALE